MMEEDSHDMNEADLDGAVGEHRVTDEDESAFQDFLKWGRNHAAPL